MTEDYDEGLLEGRVLDAMAALDAVMTRAEQAEVRALLGRGEHQAAFDALLNRLRVRRPPVGLAAYQLIEQAGRQMGYAPAAWQWLEKLVR